MRTLLAVLLALVFAAPAFAQDEELNPVIQVKYAAPPRALYLAAMHALDTRGIPIRARMLDQALLTSADFESKEPSRRDTASVMLVEIEPDGDSTQITIQARLVTGDGQLVSSESEGALARVLIAETIISAAVDTAMEALPPGAGKPDPREETDTYGYGRKNPVQVGGGAENGAANQRQWLAGLRGPGGQPVRYRRLGSCCNYEVNGARGILDAYEVTYDGLAAPVVLFIDMYAEPRNAPAPPEGFTTAPPSAPSTR